MSMEDSRLSTEAEEERSNKITELDEMSGDEESFKQIQGKVELTLKNCDELCNLINAIGSIWAVVSPVAPQVALARLIPFLSCAQSVRRFTTPW